MPVMHKTLFGASVLMFLISVIFLGLVMQELSTDIPSSSVANRQAQLTLSTIQYVIGDLILIWRVWIVWGRKHIVIVAPMVILLVGMGFALHFLITANTFYGVVPVVLIVCNTSLCTLLIAGKIWFMHRKLIQSGNIDSGSSVSSRYKGVIFLVIESGTLYTCTVVTSLILYFRSSVALPIVFDLGIPLVGILPTLIIVVVHLDELSGSNRQMRSIVLHKRSNGHHGPLSPTTRPALLGDAKFLTPTKHEPDFYLGV